MPTTFNWIFLGNSSIVLDPTEGNTTAENAALLNGSTWGSVGDPLLGRVTSATMIDNGGAAGSLDANNNAANDQFTTDIGAGTQTFTFDIADSYNATVTYVDGTTATVTAVIVQDTLGNLFLAPEQVNNTDTVVYQANAIRSITLNSVDVAGANLLADRYLTGFRDGVVSGTGGNDVINSLYVEPLASGVERIDNNDALLPGATGNDDSIRAGAGNDTAIAGLGSDIVDGGTGADIIDGGAGNDRLSGGSDASADTLFGGAGADTLIGGDGADQLWGGNDADSIEGGSGNDTIYGGGGDDTVFGGAGADLITETAPTEASGTAANGSFANGLTDWTVSNPTGGAAPNVVGGYVRFNSGNESSYGDSIQQVLTTTAGSTYTLNLTASETGSGNYSHTIRIDVLDNNGSVIATVTQPIANGATVPISLSYTALSGATTIRITNPISSGTNNSDLAVDDVVNILTAATTGGNDVLDGGAGNDTILAGAGNDIVFGGADNDQISGEDGDDTLQGDAGVDTITGGAGNDSLSGGTDDDLLQGGDGNDRLDGGAGNDTLTGGAGDDRFVWGAAAGNDVITDFGSGNTGSTSDGNQANNDFVDLSAIFNGATLAAYNAVNGTSFQQPIQALNHDLASNGGIINFNGTDMAGPTLTLTGIVGGLTIDQTNVTCFVSGTPIETARGPVPVEMLCPGDLVITRDHGPQPLRWVGQRRLSIADQILNPSLRPVRIAGGALGQEIPRRAVLVSPQHRVLIADPRAEMLFGEAEVLVIALHLVNGATVTRPFLAEITYVHLLFDRHEVVQSAGLWSESLQPAERQVDAMRPAQRAEIMALFPDLATGAYPSARPTLKAHEARVLRAG